MDAVRDSPNSILGSWSSFFSKFLFSEGSQYKAIEHLIGFGELLYFARRVGPQKIVVAQVMDALEKMKGAESSQYTLAPNAISSGCGFNVR